MEVMKLEERECFEEGVKEAA
ncbi:uncharacterized protein G2W53_023430 [Senna tora]|uniref:Uncharacterized protein n=1 Tax=Senna tora TaxID=362788 RepID=A0A834TB72_9FABA|nr:uncharacterized protein G2W53_023430 [Senna tora]